jgi:hypothetical protein
VATVVFGDFEWDDEKAAANVQKHGVTFEEAAAAFTDPFAIDKDDLAEPKPAPDRGDVSRRSYASCSDHPAGRTDPGHQCPQGDKP